MCFNYESFKAGRFDVYARAETLKDLLSDSDKPINDTQLQDIIKD